VHQKARRACTNPKTVFQLYGRHFPQLKSLTVKESGRGLLGSAAKKRSGTILLSDEVTRCTPLLTRVREIVSAQMAASASLSSVSTVRSSPAPPPRPSKKAKKAAKPVESEDTEDDEGDEGDDDDDKPATKKPAREKTRSMSSSRKRDHNEAVRDQAANPVYRFAVGDAVEIFHKESLGKAVIVDLEPYVQLPDEHGGADACPTGTYHTIKLTAVTEFARSGGKLPRLAHPIVFSIADILVPHADPENAPAEIDVPEEEEARMLQTYFDRRGGGTAKSRILLIWEKYLRVPQRAAKPLSKPSSSSSSSSSSKSSSSSSTSRASKRGGKK
jgi:hypothetical protein